VKIEDCIDEHFPISKVAERLHIDTRTIKKDCIDGKLDYLQIGNTITIPVSAITNYQNKQKPRQVIVLEKQVKELREELNRKNDIIRKVTADLMREVSL